MRELKRPILTEQYKEDQLLSTRELSDEFGISRTPVMQALRRLAYEGFIDDIPGKGMFVSRVRIEDFMELSEIKMGLESMAARLCAIRRTERELKEMEEVLLQHEREYKKGNLPNCPNRSNISSIDHRRCKKHQNGEYSANHYRAMQPYCHLCFQ